MANQKTSDLTANTAPASGDLINHVDISDTSMAATGTNKKATLADTVTKGHGLSDGAVVSVATGTMSTSQVTASAAELNILDGATLSTTELNYVDGVTSDIQTQINGKQASDADLTTIAGLTATTDNFIQSKSSAWASRTPTQVTADLIAMVGDSGSGGTKGLVPAPASGDAAAGKFLKADGTWAAAGGGTPAYTLVGSATLGSAAAICTVSGLNLDSDKVYIIEAYVVADSGGSCIVGWQANSDTTAGNYRTIRISGDGTTAGTARVSTNALSITVPASKTRLFRFEINSASGQEVFGTMLGNGYDSIGSMQIRYVGIAWNSTTNLSSFSIIDSSGSNYMGAGTQVRVFSAGF